jgi:uncharacterized protein
MSKIVIGRDREKALLDRIMSGNEAAFISVYGRRRVGKTYLIRQYLRQQIVFDLTGKKDGSLEEQMQNFYAEYLTRTKGRKETMVPKSWQEAFTYLINYLTSLPARKSKLVIFLDEMPWMDGPRSRFVSALEYLWNQHLSKMHNVVLIACGSSTSWIRKNLIHARGGLYNRVTHRMKLSPFTLYETEQFLKSKGLRLNRSTILELYMAIGGIPHYLKEITEVNSAAKIINTLCFTKGALLMDEYNQLYHSLFVNADQHIKIVETLAKSHYGLTQAALVKKSKLAQSTLSRTLEELEECDFITKNLPIDKLKKEAIYRLTDPFSLFYHKFIKNHKPNIKDAWQVYSATQTYAIWCGYAFENTCLVHIDQITQKLGISGISTAVNSWYFAGNETLPGSQIDIIIDRADRAMNLCEIKFTHGQFTITKDYAAKLMKTKSIFYTVVKNKKSLLTTLITTNDPLENEHYNGQIDSLILLNDLFE